MNNSALPAAKYFYFDNQHSFINELKDKSDLLDKRFAKEIARYENLLKRINGRHSQVETLLDRQGREKF